MWTRAIKIIKNIQSKAAVILNAPREYDRRNYIGMGLFIFYAFCLLFGVRYGDRVVRKLNLEARPARPLVILMYHNIAPDGTENLADVTVTVSKLREDFDCLRENGYTPVLPSELLNNPEDLPEKPVLLTFDDGYTTNYTLLYPILQEYQYKCVIAPIVVMPDLWSGTFCSWDMYREMISSGLVEVGSHSYQRHNLEIDGMTYPEGHPNGVQRLPDEPDEDFNIRVLQDIALSHERIIQELKTDPVFFAYPFGATEPDAQKLIDDLFPVSVTIQPGIADLYLGTARMPRNNIAIDTDLNQLLAELEK